MRRISTEEAKVEEWAKVALGRHSIARGRMNGARMDESKLSVVSARWGTRSSYRKLSFYVVG